MAKTVCLVWLALAAKVHLAPASFSRLTVAQGWGVFEQVREERGQSNRIHLRYGSLRLSSLTLNVPEGTGKTHRVELNGRRLQAAAVHEDSKVSFAFAQPLVLSQGDHLELQIG